MTAEEQAAVPRPKRRRLRGACDICRKQKARCNSSEMPGNICSNCISFGSECTHSGQGGSSSNLRNTLRTAQDHITSILSGSTEYIEGEPVVIHQVLVGVAQYARRLEEALAATTMTKPSWTMSNPHAESHSSAEEFGDTDTDSDNDGVLVDANLSEPLRQITRDISSNRFYGKSSSIHFIKAVMSVKMETAAANSLTLQAQRPEFWNVRPWEMTSEIFVPHLFPEPELLKALLDLFFEQVNPLVYVLHAPTFRSAVAAGLHLYNQQFGAVVLAACALGAKLSDDPRVFLDGAHSEHSAGWKWFRQVRPVPSTFFASPTLYELQLICLSVLYLAGGSTPEQCWALVGVGVHMAYDIGAHRRIRSHGETLESELYKRAFWVLFCCDTIMSSLLGRPRSTAIEDIDIDLPVALEGEDPIVTIYGPLLLKLMEIWLRVQNAIYPVKRKEQAYQEIVAELDSALNQWVDSIPDELRWDPNRQDLICLNQSACLYVTYYHVQILLHRPFIPSPENTTSLSSTSFPSLAICANAARSCAHVMEVQSKRGAGPLYNPQIISALFDSAVVLLLNVFNRSRPGADQTVGKCLSVLRAYERRWQVAGRNADIIAWMLEGASIPPSLKRTRSLEEIPVSTTETVSDSSQEPRSIAGRARVAAMTQEIERLQMSEQEIERLLFLPLHTEDLGRLPVYESFDFDSIFNADAIPGNAGSVADSSHFPLLDFPPSDRWDADWGSYVGNG